MTMHSLEQATIVALGFLLGAVFATSIAPGNMLMLMGTGIVFGYFARALFDQEFGGDWFWPFGRPSGRKTSVAKPTTGHRQPDSWMP